MNKPIRGEVWLVDLGYSAKIRPGLVLSIPCDTQDRSLATVIPHTTSTRGSRFEISVPKPFLKPGACDAQNPVTIPTPKLIKKLGALAQIEFTRVEAAIRTWLGL